MAVTRDRRDEPETVRRSLNLRWAATSLTYAVALMVAWRWMGKAWSLESARQWAVLSAAVLFYLLLFLWRQLPANKPDSEGERLPTFGWGTNLSLFRGLLIGLMAGFLFSDRPSGWLAWLPAILYTTFAILDFVDGYLARISDHQTMLGEALDLELDALGLLIAVLLGIGYGSLPVWFLLIGLARYAFAAGSGLRRRKGAAVYDLSPSRYRRAIAGLTIGFLSVMLWPFVGPPGSRLASAVFFLPIGASFTRDWLVVRGSIDPSSKLYLRRMPRVERLLGGWLPVLLRALTLATLGPLLFIVWAAILGGSDFSLIVGLLVGERMLLILTIMASVGMLLMMLGYAPRIGSLLLLLPLGLWITATELDVRGAIALVSVMGVLILGAGYASLKQADWALFMRRPGETNG